MATSAASGSTSITQGADVTLNGAAFTTAGTYVLHLDLTNLVAGDELRIRVSGDVIAADAERVVDEFYVAGPQATPHWMSDPYEFVSGETLSYILRMVTATSRTIPWEVRTL